MFDDFGDDWFTDLEETLPLPLKQDFADQEASRQTQLDLDEVSDFEDDEAKEVFSWLDKYRDQDGGYWMGYQTEQKMNWPLEKPPWTSGAVILATDTVFNITPASELFSK